MSQQYDEYLHEHISNVRKALEWMIDHNIVPAFVEINDGSSIAYPCQVSVLGNAEDHDKSKFDDAEYGAYDDYFYGKEGKDEDDISVIDSAFDYAWLHHIHHNPHHWQYWVLVNDDDGKPKPLEMPRIYVIEMIADWMSFSFKSGNLTEIFDWYDAHSEKMILHPNTRKLVEGMLNQMERILKKDEEKDDVQTPS